MAKNIKPKKKIMAISMPENITDGIQTMSSETGVSKSELMRRAATTFLNGSCNEPQIMLNLVLLTQDIKKIKDCIPSETYENIQTYIGNVMHIKSKGGIACLY